MRLFISIDLPEEVQNELSSWIPDLPGIRKVKPEQLHLTLQFLGKCKMEQKDVIINKLTTIHFEPFRMVIKGIGAFPNRKNPAVIWAGVEKNTELMELQRRVSNLTKEYANEFKKRSFKPHITLGRVKNEEKVDFFDEPGQKEEIVVNVHYFTLKKSELKAEGSRHKLLWKFE